MALYLSLLLKGIGVPQNTATILYESTMGAYLMASAGQPTTCTRHMEIT